jgi:protein-S-isoprenylcysteine O-methyltransferase Ste14
MPKKNDMAPIFPVIYIIWLLSEIFLNRMLRSESSDKQNADKNSLKIIWITVVLSNALALLISMNIYFPIAASPETNYAGLVVITIGILLRIAVVISLGRYFTVDVTIRQDHQLKTDGFYSFLRHPSYFASLLSFVGFGISLNNWISLALVVVAILIVFVMRIKIEENVLIGQFGNTYLDYKKRTKGLIPFVW